jgi:hypothetical protein
MGTPHFFREFVDSLDNQFRFIQMDIVAALLSNNQA